MWYSIAVQIGVEEGNLMDYIRVTKDNIEKEHILVFLKSTE